MKYNIFFKHIIKEKNLEDLKLYFHPKVFLKYCKECQYYNKIWTCPPYEFEVEKVMEGYKFAYIIGSKLHIDELRNDYKELFDKKDIEHVTSEVYKIARTVLDKKLDEFSDWKNQLCVLYAGRCLVCEQCNREKQQPCIHPQRMHFSLESIGFDVASICEDILEDQILWAKEDLPEYLLLVSAVFSKERVDIKDIYNTIA
jgi:predicted metal-binding protein